MSAPPPSPPPSAPGTEIALPPLDRQAVNEIFDAAVRRYIAGRRERIPDFVTRNFALNGSLELHRRAFGLDLVRAPYNVVAGAATVARDVGAAGLRIVGARRAAARLKSRNLFWKTQVARELEWRLHADLLELPLDQGDRRTDRDRLVEEALSDPRLAVHFDRLLTLVGERAGDGAFREKVRSAMQGYLGQPRCGGGYHRLPVRGRRRLRRPARSSRRARRRFPASSPARSPTRPPSPASGPGRGWAAFTTVWCRSRPRRCSTPAFLPVCWRHWRC